MGNGPVATALDTLRHITERLPSATPEERERLLALQAEAVELLEASGPRHTSSAFLRERVRKLLPKFQQAGYSRTRARDVLMERFGVSRTYAYELLAEASTTQWTVTRDTEIGGVQKISASTSVWTDLRSNSKGPQDFDDQEDE